MEDLKKKQVQHFQETVIMSPSTAHCMQISRKGLLITCILMTHPTFGRGEDEDMKGKC